jgi:hypothetical protein
MTAPAPAPLVRPVQNPLAAWRELDGAVVIISPEDSVLHELNLTGSFIWKESTGNLTIEEIAARVAQEFAVEPSTALADTREFVAALLSKRLLLEAGRG